MTKRNKKGNINNPEDDINMAGGAGGAIEEAAKEPEEELKQKLSEPSALLHQKVMYIDRQIAAGYPQNQKANGKSQTDQMWHNEINSISKICRELKEVVIQLDSSSPQLGSAVLPQGGRPEHRDMLYAYRSEALEQLNEKIGNQPLTEREMIRQIEPLLLAQGFSSGQTESDKRISELSLDRLKGLNQVIDSKRGRKFNDRIDSILNDQLQKSAEAIKDKKQFYKEQILENSRVLIGADKKTNELFSEQGVLDDPELKEDLRNAIFKALYRVN